MHLVPRRALALFALASSLFGCTLPVNEEAKKVCRGGREQAYILTSLSFTREIPPGSHIAPGFDLDHRTTTQPEDQKCGHVDLTAPDGTPGIDNQLALLVPEIDRRFGNAIDGIIQGAINDGRLLIAFDLQHLDDTAEDSCVDLRVELAQGKPSVGTDGVVEAFQTFDPRKTGQEISVGTGGKIEKRVFSVGPFPLRIPIAVFDVSFIVFIRDAVVRFSIDEQGEVTGLLGGGVSMDEIIDGVKNGAGLAPLIPQLRVIGNAFADLGYDPVEGKCSLVSAALAFKARPAFVRASSR